MTQAILLTSYPFLLSSSYTEPLHLLLVDDDFAHPLAFHEQLLLPKTVGSSSSLPSRLFWQPSPSCLTQVKCVSRLLPQHSKCSPITTLIILHYSILMNYLPPHPRYRPMRARMPLSCSFSYAQHQQDVHFSVDVQHMPRIVPGTQQAQQ